MRNYTGMMSIRCIFTITSRGVITKRAGTISTSSAGSTTPCKSRLILFVIAFWPLLSLSIWSCSWISPNAVGLVAFKSGCRFIKSPMCAPFLYPEHDLFIQLTKLKNTLRYLQGEGQIIHPGLEYYQQT